MNNLKNMNSDALWQRKKNDFQLKRGYLPASSPQLPAFMNPSSFEIPCSLFDIHRGFDLDVDEVKGDHPDDQNPEPGWFFVIQERAGDVRFGLDEPEDQGGWDEDIVSWSQMHWGHVAFQSGEQTVDDINYINIDNINQVSLEEQLTWAQNSANKAIIFFQNPVKVFIHASQMI